MIGPPPGTRVYLACGVTDMRSGDYRNFRVWGRTMLLKEPSYAATQTTCHPG
jgi:hypothetical protein